MPLRRTIYTDIEAFLLGPMTEVCPDVTIKKNTVDQATGATTELDPADIMALVFMTDDGANVYVLDPQTKQNLLSTLTGGVQVAGVGELHKLGGL